MQQPKGQMQPKAAGEWNTSLWGCFSDCGNCITTLFCPCITYGQIANIVDQGKTSCFNGGKTYALLMYFTFFGCCLYSCFARSKLRYMYNLPPSPCGCGDCVVHTCCEPCALCQEYRELQSRGFNMSVGYDLNNSQAGSASVHPPIGQMMGQMQDQPSNQQNNYNQNGGYNNQNMNRQNAPPNQTTGQNDAYNNQNDYQNDHHEQEQY